MKASLLFTVRVFATGGLFMLITFTSSAQINDYLMHNPVWRDSSSCAVPYPCIQQEGFNYYTAGDSVWNALTYKKIFRKGAGVYMWFSMPPAQCSGTYSFVDTVPSFLLRSAGKQMFIKVPTEPTEYLLYDFDLQVGDTLPETYNNPATNIIYVAAIDSIYTPYGYRKRFELDGGNSAQYLIEGIGSSHGLIAPYGSFFDCGYALNCFSLNDTSWYPAQGISCNIPLSIQEAPEAASVSVNPNPMTTQTQVTTPVTWKNASLAVIDSRGRIVFETFGLKGNSTTISRNGLAAGTYIIRISEGDATSFSQLLIAGD